MGLLGLLAAALALWGGPAAAQEADVPPPPPTDTVTAPDSTDTPDTGTPDADSLSADTPASDAPGAEEPARISIGAEDVERIQVDADRFETYEDEAGARIVKAAGNVRATVTGQPEPGLPAQPGKPGLPGQAPQTTVILADTMTANMDSRTLSAQGNVVLSSEGRTATGEALEYRWRERTARVENVSFREYGISFRARALDVQARRLVVYDAGFSTCGLENPDFEITADRITIVPDKRIVARGVTLELFQRRIIRLSRLEYRLQGGQARGRRALPLALPLPRPGYSRASGLSLAQPIPVGRNIDAEIEPTTRVGLRGRVLWEREGNVVSPFAEASWKQEESVRDRSPVFVSRLPVVGLRFGEDDGGEVSAGSFREHSTGVREGRLHLAYTHKILDRGTRPGVSMRVGALASLYTNGDHYRDVNAEVSLGRGGEDTFEEVGLRLNDIGGNSPFLWDRVQVRTEAFGAKRIAVGAYRLEGLVRYDMDRSKFYDIQVAVGRRFSCLEPELRYSTRSQSISVGLKVFGIGPAGD